MGANKFFSKIIEELNNTLCAIDLMHTNELVDLVLSANSIFIAGAGRSGLAAKGFAMRLMHMGMNAYVVGETTTPNIRPGDLLLIGSGSGETASLSAHAKKGKDIGAKLALITIFPDSTIGSLADVVVQIPAPTPKVEADSGFMSIQPMGSLFEQCLWLFLDTAVLMMMDINRDDSGNMFNRHANLE